MGKGKSVTAGYWYYMGLHFGISHGPVDAVQKVIVGERDAWTGSATTNTTVAIDAPDLFGGEKREGGVVGNLDVMMGGPAQTANTYLTSQLGSPQPAFRGILGAVFDGKVTALNPYIKPWAFKVKRILQGWASGSAWYSAKAEISGDMNPAHILYQCLTDPSWGMGYPTSSILDSSFTAAADKLYAEGFGLSILWNKQATIEEFIKLVLDHIGGIVYVTQDTGQFALKLIRDDYVKASLPLYGPSNLANVTDYQRRGWGETVNEVTVVYNDAATNKEAGVTVQDLANIATQGQVVSQTRRYPGISNAGLAQRVALRDLRNVSLPISRAKLTANRAAWNLIPGDPIRLTWPAYGIEDVVFRVMEVNRGTLTDGEITVEVVEDIYALPSNSYTQAQTGLWTSPNTQPANLTLRQLIEAPYYDIVRTLSEADMAYVDANSAYLQTLGARNAGDSFGYGIATNGTGSYVEEGAGPSCPTATLASQITPATSTTTTVTSGIDLSQVTLNNYAIIVGTSLEYVQVTALNASTGAITMNRGMLDTVPQTHAAGTRIWFAQDNLGFNFIEYANGQNLGVRLLTRTSLGQLAIASATINSITMSIRQNRPYPPGNFTIGGQYYPATLTNTAPNLSWASRNRLTQTAGLVLQTQSNITLEAGATFSVEIRNADANVVLATSTGITASTYTPPSLITGTFRMRVQVWSVRGGVDSYQRQDYTFPYSMPSPAVVPGVILTASSRIVVPLASTAPGSTVTARTERVFGKAESNSGTSGSAVQLLLHADGSNGSTTFTDSSGKNLTVTALGNAQISTAQSEFGGASATMSGVTGALQIGTPGTLPAGFSAFQSHTWTVEGWAYISSAETIGYSTLFALESAAGGAVPNLAIATVNFNPKLSLEIYANGVNQVTPDTIRDRAPARNEWFHWAAVCDGGRLRLFINGQSILYRIDGNSTFDWLWISPSVPSDCNVYIGKSATGYFANLAGSYVDEVRVSSVVRYAGTSYGSVFTIGVDTRPTYTADFEPPSLAFANPV